MRVRMTNKTTKVVLEGECVNCAGSSFFNVLLDGCRDMNAFHTEEWDVEELLELPTKMCAVIRFKWKGDQGDSHPREAVLIRSLGAAAPMWHVDKLGRYDPESFRTTIKDVTVLFEGVED